MSDTTSTRIVATADGNACAPDTRPPAPASLTAPIATAERTEGEAAPARFYLCAEPLDAQALRAHMADAGCGGLVVFEGWVRDHNEGRRVLRLEYEAFAPLAHSEGKRVLAEAQARFGVTRALCAHRVGALDIGGLAVWVGVAAAHRGEAFDACRYIIDEIKHRLPIWKKEHYVDGDSGWVNCERCAEAAASHHTHTHSHSHR